MLVNEAQIGSEPQSADYIYQKGRDLLLEGAIGGNMEAEVTLGQLAYETSDFIQSYEW